MSRAPMSFSQKFGEKKCEMHALRRSSQKKTQAYPSIAIPFCTAEMQMTTIYAVR